MCQGLAWDYAIGGWRSASLEVGGTRLRQGYGAARKTEVGGQRSEDSVATPCSVKAVTRFEYLIFEDVTDCDILFISSLAKVNMKS